MDKVCDDLHATSCQPLHEFVSDIWDAEFLRQFEGPTKKVVFVVRGKEGKYLVAFNYDSFKVVSGYIPMDHLSSCLLAMQMDPRRSSQLDSKSGLCR